MTRHVGDWGLPRTLTRRACARKNLHVFVVTEGVGLAFIYVAENDYSASSFVGDCEMADQIFRWPRTIADRQCAVEQTELPAAAESVRMNLSATQDWSSPVTVDDDWACESSRFTVAEELGRGAFGAVFKAFDHKLNRYVALKVARQRTVSQQRWTALLHEARQVAKLEHPHIVPVYDVVRRATECFIVYKLVEGDDLLARIRERKITYEEAAQITVQIADALNYAHLAGIYHRDVKPANILLDRAGQAYITDFGLAVEESCLATERDKLSGTLAYMAPEQVRGDADCVERAHRHLRLGSRLVRNELRTAAFRGREVASQILRREPRPPRQFAPDVPSRLQEICLRACPSP